MTATNRYRRTRRAVPEDAPGIARVHVASWQTTYPDIVPDSYLGRMPSERDAIEDRWKLWLTGEPRGRVFLVSEGEGSEGIIGFASGGPPLEEGYPDYDSWLYTIYLHVEWQGYGRGVELMLAAARELLEKGNRSMLLWVMAGNSRARRFYESLGGKPVATSEFEVEGTVIPEIAYGWKDLSRLVREE